MALSPEEIRSRNVSAVEAFYDAERRRDVEDWGKLWRLDGRQTFFLARDVPPVVGRDELIRVTQRKFEVRPPYGIGLITEALADPSRVLARLHLTFGETIRPVDLWCMFTFDDAGLILEIEEIVDTAHAHQLPE